MSADLRQSALGRAVGDVLQDVADLVQMELRLAKSELASSLHAVAWKVASLAIAAVFALATVLILAEAAIFGLIDRGAAAYVACLMVGRLLALLAIIAYAIGRGGASLTPSRTFHQVNADLRTAKEHLT